MNEVQEVWKPVPEIDDITVSNIGNVKYKNKLIALHKNSRGYILCSINHKIYRVHRLVAMAFIPIPERFENVTVTELQINHIDGNKINNYSSNLEWSNNSENQLHRYRVINKPNRKRKVQQLDLISHSVIKTFNSIADAECALGLKSYTIRDVLEGNKKEAGGYSWKYFVEK